MIAQPKLKYKHLLDKRKIMQLRNIARRGTDAELESLFRECAMIYVADSLGAQVVDEERCLVVGDELYECECPECHNMLTLDLKGLLNNG